MNEYMEVALKEARKASKKMEVPVGAIIVYNNIIIAKAHNNRQNKYSVLGHAEINAIIKANKKIKDWRLDKCELYVTLYPCKMCEMIIKESRIKKVYYILDKPENIKNNTNYIKIEEINDFEKYKDEVKSFFRKMRN